MKPSKVSRISTTSKKFNYFDIHVRYTQNEIEVLIPEKWEIDRAALAADIRDVVLRHMLKYKVH